MMTLTEPERSFLQNYLLDRYQDDSKRQNEGAILKSLLGKLSIIDVDETTQENGYLQYILLELGEINGSLSSTANEKQPIKMGTWRPQVELGFVYTIGVKLGAAFQPSSMPAPDEVEQRSSPIGN